MTQSLHGRQMAASLKLGEALERLRTAHIRIQLWRELHAQQRADLIVEARNEIELAVAAIEAAVKEG